MRWLYFAIDFLTAIIPLIFSFHPKLKFHKHFRPFLIGSILTAIIFITWDIYFTQWGVWGFNSRYVSGVYFLNLPIEEVLFFFCIPFACLFTYHCLNLFFQIRWSSKTENAFVIIVSVVLFALGLFSQHQLYTFSTCISLSVLLVVLKYGAKIEWLGKLVLIYPVLLIPFFIVNGILTGTGLEEPVVWYNPHENLGIRLLTIPVEDVFYGFELILLNVFFYEYMLGRSRKPAGI